MSNPFRSVARIVREDSPLAARWNIPGSAREGGQAVCELRHIPIEKC